MNSGGRQQELVSSQDSCWCWLISFQWIGSSHHPSEPRESTTLYIQKVRLHSPCFCFMPPKNYILWQCLPCTLSRHATAQSGLSDNLNHVICVFSRILEPEVYITLQYSLTAILWSSSHSWCYFGVSFRFYVVFIYLRHISLQPRSATSFNVLNNGKMTDILFYFVTLIFYLSFISFITKLIECDCKCPVCKLPKQLLPSQATCHIDVVVN